MSNTPQIINELSTPEPTQNTSPPKNIYEENFRNWIPEDGTAVLRAICAVGDEIRALRMVFQPLMDELVEIAKARDAENSQ